MSLPREGVSQKGISISELLNAGGGCQEFIDTVNSNVDDETINWYINNESEGFDRSYVQYTIDTVEKLDDIIDLDFQLVQDDSASHININLQDFSDQDYMGLVFIDRDRRYNYWTEINVVDYSSQGESSESNKNTFIHELGHALGLGEPGYDKSWDQDDTAMSYNSGDIGWQTWYTESDIDALIYVWGEEDDNLSGALEDLNNDGFVDGITNYQLWTNSGGVDLKNRRGKTFSDDTSRKWNAIKAIEINDGFSVLVEGQQKKNAKYKVVSANDEGIIGKATRWLDGDQMMSEGYETLFAMDFTGDNIIN